MGDTELKIPEKKLENGRLTYRQLKTVADHFGYSPLFFLEPGEPRAEKILSPNFRALTNQSVQIDSTLARIIKRTEWHRDLYIGLTEELEEETNYVPLQISGTIAQKADAVRHWLGVNDTQSYKFDDYRKLVEAKGILVFRSTGYKGAWKLKNDSVVGFSITHPQVPLIFIKKTSPEMQTFTLFHELGHLLLHNRSCIDNEDNLRSNQSEEDEREANQFAADCLLPEEALRDIAQKIPEEPELYDSAFKGIARRRGISVEVIVVALLKQNKVSKSDYSIYRAIKKTEWEDNQEKSGSRKYRHREPLHIFGTNYVGTVFSALHTDKVTLNKASNYLDRLKMEDLKKLDNFL